MEQKSQAETVDASNRARFTLGGALRNEKQSLCKGARLIPGELIAGEVSAQGDWTTYARLIAQANNPRRKEALERKSSAASTKCNTEKTRGVFRPLNDPFWWLDTGGSNGLEQEDDLFEIERDENGIAVLSTESTLTNIHSHYLGANFKVSNRKTLVYTGQFQLESSDGGIGVTFLSDYPNSDSYYRLRRLAGETLHIAPHPDQSEFPELIGDIDSEVTPMEGVWYNFEIRTSSNAQGTRILGKVWAEGEQKPQTWQIDATDTSAERFTSGKIGVWSMATGRKSWKNLKAKYILNAVEF
jgi:hypothetical protein